MATLRDTYFYCTACKTRLKDNGPAKVCPNCGKQYYFNPIPNVSALIINRDGEVLFIERATEPFKGMLDLPGGFVDEGESLERAVHREANEEIGAEVIQLRYLSSVPTIYELNGIVYNLVLVFFEAELKNEKDLVSTSEATRYKFFNKEAIPLHKVAFKAQREFLELYRSDVT